MALIDTSRLRTTTEHIHKECLKASGAKANRDLARMTSHYRSAATAACELMTELTGPEIETASRDISDHRDSTKISQALQNPEFLRSFLDAEERLLRELELDPALIESVMGRCLDFIEQDPSSWREEDLLQAFDAAKFRVCSGALQISGTDARDAQGEVFARRAGRVALRAAIGVTIVAVNYMFIGPTDVIGQLSTAYGVSWLPVPIKD